MRIEVGRGLEGKLTDLTAGRIIDLVVKPKFKAEDYDGGFTAGVSALIDATRGEFTADRRAPSGGQEPYVPFAGGIPPWLAFLMLIGFFAFFAAMARSRAHHNQLSRRGLEGAEERRRLSLLSASYCQKADPPQRGLRLALVDFRAAGKQRRRCFGGW
jgi:uncharacterized membrane protein YgcG